MQYDAILVGAGVNSLAAAAHLAASGWRVGLFEKAATPGGAVKTEALTLPGYRHDVAAMNLSMFAGSAFHAKYADELKSHGFALAPAAHPFASAFPDGSFFGVSADLDTTLGRFADSRDADTWREMVAAFPARAASVGGLLGAPMTPRSLAGQAWRAWRAHGAGGTADLMRLLAASPRAWLTETFRDPKVQATLGAWGMHLDFAPDIAGGAVFPYLEAMANQCFGMVIGAGGAGTLTDALCAMIRARGGEIHCATEVTEICVENGRAVGVRLDDGTVTRAAKAVLANVAPRGLARLLKQGSGDARYDAGLARFRHGPGTMMIHLALDALPPWRAAGLQRFAYVHIAPSLDYMASVYTEAMAGLLPRAPILVVGQPTVVDPSRAPEGRHTLWVQVRALPADIRGDAAGEITGTDWAELREAYADRAMALLEQYAPGLGAHVLARTVESPADLEARNPNLVGGDQVCGSHHLDQNFLYRPVRGHADWSTPVKALHLIGAASWPGAGTGAASGFMAASRIAGK
ncbi:NAD(P)/FAD-dependent oxidoreductase [Oceanicella sp. SM1341]|uniref:phytoene desaturase family protein n=1 Tax=Oceanicella sp. SM1341 TaxID=1548889 RepID=UPI000E47A56A|nr:NAD(P)/FAD-dependent oxidoreductase [Oceanicella sp. SM1341]